MWSNWCASLCFKGGQLWNLDKLYGEMDNGDVMEPAERYAYRTVSTPIEQQKLKLTWSEDSAVLNSCDCFRSSPRRSWFSSPLSALLSLSVFLRRISAIFIFLYWFAPEWARFNGNTPGRRWTRCVCDYQTSKLLTYRTEKKSTQEQQC